MHVKDLGFKEIMDKIAKTWPDWTDWYLSLDTNKQAQLNKRMNMEGDNFIKKGMWEYAEYAAYRSCNRKQIELKTRCTPKDELLVLNNKLKKQYGFDLLQSESLTKVTGVGKFKS